MTTVPLDGLSNPPLNKRKGDETNAQTRLMDSKKKPDVFRIQDAVCTSVRAMVGRGAEPELADRPFGPGFELANEKRTPASPRLTIAIIERMTAPSNPIMGIM